VRSPEASRLSYFTARLSSFAYQIVMVRAPFMRASSFASPLVPAAGRQLCWMTTLVAVKRPAGTCTDSSPTIEPFAVQTNCARQPGSLLSM
jgi:hypothetical protein